MQTFEAGNPRSLDQYSNNHKKALPNQGFKHSDSDLRVKKKKIMIPK